MNQVSPPPETTGLPVSPEPYVPPPPEGPKRDILTLSLADPFRWLSRGFHCLRSQMGIGLFYGGCFWAMAFILGAVFRNMPEYTMSFASGCLLAGPFLAMGLYEVSRRRELGLPSDLATSLTCWDSHVGSMGMMVLVLIVLELLWGRASLVVFAVFFNTGMPSTANVVQAVFNPDNWEFLAVYSAIGGIFAALVYSSTVVALPMILDRDTDAISAVLTSFAVVFHNTAVMLLWGLLITVLVGAALLLPWGLGLLVVGPWLGHASWHAYRGSVRWLDEAATPLEAA